jgi:predicted deacetylase
MRDRHPRTLSVSLHDVAPQTWPACERLLDLVAAVGCIPVTLLVVPDYHHRGLACFSPAYRSALERRLEQGDELALHGWCHLDEAPPSRHPIAYLQRRLLTAREGEFAALSAADAQQRLQEGIAWFARLGWPLHGFVAPAWLMSAGTWQALGSTRLGYATTLRSIYLLPERRPIDTRALVHSVRSRLRRRLSLIWNEALRWRLRKHPLVRVALHPADAAYPEVMDHWARVLRSLLPGRDALTKVELVQRLRQA